MESEFSYKESNTEIDNTDYVVNRFHFQFQSCRLHTLIFDLSEDNRSLT